MKIKNIKNTLNSATGTDLIFEPKEVKDLPEETAKLILHLAEDFEEDTSQEIVSEITPETTPEVAPEPVLEDSLTCECGFKAKTKAGLKAHQRKCL